MGPGRAQVRTQARVWMAPPRDSNRLLGLSEMWHLEFPEMKAEVVVVALLSFHISGQTQGPLRTKNTTALNSRIVFCYRHSFYYL